MTQSFYQMIILSVVLFWGKDIFNVESSIGLSLEEWNEKTG